MLRTILAVISGLVTWVVLVSLGGLVIRATWPEYVAVAQSMHFTLSPCGITRTSCLR